MQKLPDSTIEQRKLRKIACISDIHGNLEALKAVLADIRDQGVSIIFCLGDIVGYGPDPGACVDLICENSIPAILGNHDSYAFSDSGLEQINKAAVRTIMWTRDQLSADQKQWLASLPLELKFPQFSLVHGSLKEPERWGYVLNREDADACFLELDRRLVFIGHTHRPHIFQQLNNEITDEVLKEFKLNKNGRYIINCGSVGQPRDDQESASYVIYNSMLRSVKIHRVKYDVEKTKQKILDNHLPEINALRLTGGL